MLPVALQLNVSRIGQRNPSPVCLHRVRIGLSTNIRVCVRAQLTFCGRATFRLVGPPGQNYFTLKTIQLLSGRKIKFIIKVSVKPY